MIIEYNDNFLKEAKIHKENFSDDELSVALNKRLALQQSDDAMAVLYDKLELSFDESSPYKRKSVLGI